MQHISESVEETARIAGGFVESLGATPSKALKATVVGLYGDLGSGKTCFVQSVGVSLGISENMVSPTFVIEKIYKIDHKYFDHLVHVDAYRIEKEEELLHLGWQELLENKRNLIFVEWPEKVARALPKSLIKINFKFVDEHTREIEFENYEV